MRTMAILVGLGSAIVGSGAGCVGSRHLGEYTRQNFERIFATQASHRRSQTDRALHATAEEAEAAAVNYRQLLVRTQEQGGAPAPLLPVAK